MKNTKNRQSATEANPVDRLEQCPVFGICGCSGAGKTTLIEALIPLLLSQGLQVAVVKDGAHNVRIDKPGKDSDRFFQAGADVSLFGEVNFNRRHESGNFNSFLINLCDNHDIVLVEGHASTPIPKIWLLGSGFEVPPENRGRVLQVLSRKQAAVHPVLQTLLNWLEERQQQTPVWGCLLIGGKSSRMGRAKHLIEADSTTWLEKAVFKMASHVQQVVLSGKGEVPDSLAALPRIPDIPGLAGPLAGMLAVMRWQPAVSWLVMACDLPAVQPESLQWLLERRSPGVRAILPDLNGNGHIEPLLAWYDYRCQSLLENIAGSGSLRISGLAGRQGICHFQPPKELHPSWQNINTPAELAALGEEEYRPH
jgi:molybdopterin-guanine dinucleotide biosynthesis protein MobB